MAVVNANAILKNFFMLPPVNLSSLWGKDENRVLKVEYAMETNRVPKIWLSFACKSVTAIRCAKTPPLAHRRFKLLLHSGHDRNQAKTIDR